MTRFASLIGFISCALVSAAASAQSSDIFECVGENGEKVFTNTGNLKKCKRIDVQPILTLPASSL